MTRHAKEASRLAWRLRKWDLYERPREAARLQERHPELLAAAEEACEVAASLRHGAMASISGAALAIAAAAGAAEG